MNTRLQRLPRRHSVYLSTAILSLLSLIGWKPVYSESPELGPVLERIIEVYGGEDNLRKLESHVQEWDVVALMGKRHGTDIRTVRAPDQLKVEVTYPTSRETRIIDGEASYVVYGDGAAKDARQPQRDSMRLQLMRLYSPLVLRDKLDSLTLKSNGDSSVITLLEHGVRVDYVVNADSWRIEKVVGTLAANGAAMQFVTEYSQFSFYDGVLVHGRENKFAGGVNTAVLQLRHIVLDATLHDEDFRPADNSESMRQKRQEKII